MLKIKCYAKVANTIDPVLFTVSSALIYCIHCSGSTDCIHNGPHTFQRRRSDHQSAAGHPGITERIRQDWFDRDSIRTCIAQCRTFINWWYCKSDQRCWLQSHRRQRLHRQSRDTGRTIALAPKQITQFV